MKKFRSEKGIAGIDIGIAVIVIFMFVSAIAVLIASYNSRKKQIELKAESVYIAVNEIEQMKNMDFSDFEGMTKTTIYDKSGNSMVLQPVNENPGFSKTITVEDYNEINKSEDEESDILKVVTVDISYVFKGTTMHTKLSTVLTKEI